MWPFGAPALRGVVGEGGTAPSLLGGGRSYWSGVPSSYGSCQHHKQRARADFRQTMSVAMPIAFGFLSLWKPAGTRCHVSVRGAHLYTTRCGTSTNGASLGSFFFGGSIRIELESCYSSFLGLISHYVLSVLGVHIAVGILSCLSCALALELSSP